MDSASCNSAVRVWSFAKGREESIHPYPPRMGCQTGRMACNDGPPRVGKRGQSDQVLGSRIGTALTTLYTFHSLRSLTAQAY